MKQVPYSSRFLGIGAPLLCLTALWLMDPMDRKMDFFPVELLACLGMCWLYLTPRSGKTWKCVM